MSTNHKVSFEKVDKDFHSRTLIKDAIQDNDFLKNLTPSQVKTVTEIKDFWNKVLLLLLDFDQTAFENST